jgi:hypothetical protein
MNLDVEAELVALRRSSVDQLRVKYAEVFGEPTRSRHKEYLVKRIIWRIQANEEGGLSERARQRAMELANDADLRIMAPRQPKLSPDAHERTKTVAATVPINTCLLPATTLKRDYKGRIVRVTVLDDGFEYEGNRYKSLTAAVKAITGKHWNGYHFFGLRGKGVEV